jgi:hypothetical protein
MNLRRVFYWAGPLIILWRQVVITTDHWLRRSWQSRLLEGGAMERFWVGVVAAFVGLLALAALVTHLTFFFKHRQERRRFINLSPHLLLCGVLLGTSVVLESPELLSRLSELRLDFLGRFLFYVSLVWFLAVLLRSLSPPDALLRNEMTKVEGSRDVGAEVGRSLT